MRVITILFATLFLMGCPETDTAETTQAKQVDAADSTEAAPTDATDVQQASDAQQAADVEFDAVDVEVKTEED